MNPIGFLEKTKMLIVLALLFAFFLPKADIKAEQIDISVSSVVSGTATAPTTTAPTPTPPVSGGPIYIAPETSVIFEGKAYPFAIVTIIKNSDTTIANFRAESSGLFKRQINGIAGGNYNFSIFAEDTSGEKSSVLSFNASILAGNITTISGIFLSPTIGINAKLLERGKTANIFGQSFPGSEITIFFSPEDIVKETTADANGKWKFELDTSTLVKNGYAAWAKAMDKDGAQSPLSPSVFFSFLGPRCQGADLNFDGKVDLVDFSILLYFWDQENPKNGCADINADGIVNIVDFSIMMYFWNG